MITMKRKGFTLIELLAVIVVLAMIALIATPTILGVIEKARRGAAEQSALGYVDAVEMQVSLNSLDLEKKDIKDGVYIVRELRELEVSIKGQSPSDESWVKIKDGQVVAYSLKFGRYTITLDENNNKVIEKDGEIINKPSDNNTTNPDNPDDNNNKYTVYSNGTAIYYNPETNSKCNNYTEENSRYYTKTGCMKWYTFNDEGEKSSIVNMILDHNTSHKTYWNSEANQSEPKDAIVSLKNDTSTWNSILKVRLITVDEIAKITGNTNFNSSTSTYKQWFYFDSNNQTQTAKGQGTSKYAWLYDYTDGCTNYGCSIEYKNSSSAYWTSTPVFDYSTVTGVPTYAWFIGNNGSIASSNSLFYIGVRPVITVLKNKIS